jgi:hypothetical protein
MTDLDDDDRTETSAMTDGTAVEINESNEKSKEDSRPSTTLVLTITGELLAISAALLPAVGVGIRLISFSFDPRLRPLISDVAIGQTIQSLALLGASTTVPLYLLMGLTLIVERRWPHFLAPKRMPSPAKRVLVLAAGTTVMVGFVFFFPSGISALFGLFIGAGTAIYAIRVAQLPRWSWVKILPAVIVMTLASVLLGGFVPREEPTYLLHGSNLSDLGLVSPVATNGELITMVPCRKHQSVTAVNTTAITYMTLIHTVSAKPLLQPNLYQVLVEHRTFPVGVQYACS